MIRLCWSALVGLLSIASNICISAPINGHKNVGLPPEKAAATMTVPEEFRVTLFAGEPDVHQPIAFCIDDRGRLWIAEAFTYPQRHPHSGPILPNTVKATGDRILILEDSDGDGKFDKKTVFIEGLNLISGIEVGFGGVWVGAAPYLLFIPYDLLTDKPGTPKIVLDGWHYEDTHETLNSFTWGPDGWLYGCHGVFTHSRVGKPGTSDRDRIPINAGVWRYHPTKQIFEVFSEGTSNPWGLAHNDFGDFFVEACVIPHCFHMIQGARYLRQAGNHFNPYTYAEIGTIADHLHYVGNQWNDTNRAQSSEIGGGHAHCGLMCYLGGNWPEKYRGQLFMGNIHGKRINMDILQRKGSGYVASHGADFLRANDEWARFVNCKYGPDGNVYLIDWYDKQACHHNDPVIWDRTNGRVYKIARRGSKIIKDLDLQKCTDEELVAYQSDTNDWYVQHARRILQERSLDSKRAATIQKLLLHACDKSVSLSIPVQLRYLWALHAVGGLGWSRCATVLSETNLSEYIRAWVVQLGLENGLPDESFLKSLAQAAISDPSPIVRRYLASGIQRLPLDRRKEIVSGLLSHAEDASDFNLPLLYWYGIEPIASQDPLTALELGMKGKIPFVLQFIVRRIATTSTASQNQSLIDAISKAIDENNTEIVVRILRGMSEGFKGRRDIPLPETWSSVAERLAKLDHVEVRSMTVSMSITFGNSKALNLLRTTLMDQKANVASRQAAIATLVAARDKDLPPILHQLLTEPVFRGSAIRGLASFDDPRTPPAILQVWSSLNTEDKRDALNTLASRAIYARFLLDAIASKKIASSEVSADIVRVMRNLSDREVSSKIAQIWGNIRETPSDRSKVIADLRKRLETSTGDLSLGRAVFAKLCQQCHTLYGLGGKAGPDITGSNRPNLDYLLENILDPNAVVPKDYMPITFELLSGRSLTGIVKEENVNAFTLQTTNELVVVNKDDVESMKYSKKSMMPDDLLKNLPESEIQGLFAYLKNPQQVPLLATPENVKDFFNGKDLSGWMGDPKYWSVQEGEIVGKTDRSQKMSILKSEMTAENFRLWFKVKCSGAVEKAGFFFRSESLSEGEIKGLFLSFGPNQSGNLFQEPSHLPLWRKSIEKTRKLEDWDSYLIEVNEGTVRMTINGQQLSEDLSNVKLAKRGIFALNLHTTEIGEVRLKNIKLEVLLSGKK